MVGNETPGLRLDTTYSPYESCSSEASRDRRMGGGRYCLAHAVKSVETLVM